MPYTPTTWVNGSGGGTPLSAANLNNIEDGIVDVETLATDLWGDPATTLPGSPTNRQRAILVDSTTAPTYAWLFQLVSSISDANEWLCIGGNPALVEVLTSQTTTSTSYAALATAGPSFAIPVAGIYNIGIGAFITNNTNGTSAHMSYDIGGTGAVDADALTGSAVGGGGGYPNGNFSRQTRKTLTAVTLTSKYKVSGGTGTFASRWMEVMPLRVTS